MKKIFTILILLVNVCFCQNYKEYKDFIIKSEGYKNKTYFCSKGYPTVGIGHKFESGEKILNYYSDKQIEVFFQNDLKEAIQAAQNNFPSFNFQPKEIKLVLVSFCFNLGENGAKKFVKFRKAIHIRNYLMAANELKNSIWYKQVTARANKYIEIIKKAK
jgi:GH24 family phage-related lysozyme (muramidase)